MPNDSSPCPGTRAGRTRSKAPSLRPAKAPSSTPTGMKSGLSILKTAGTSSAGGVTPSPNRAPHLTTGEDIRQPGQSQIGGCTCRIPLDISVFRLFPASRGEADPVRARHASGRSRRQGQSPLPVSWAKYPPTPHTHLGPTSQPASRPTLANAAGICWALQLQPGSSALPRRRAWASPPGAPPPALHPFPGPEGAAGRAQKGCVPER